MQIDQLRTLLAVLENGSFSRAAQALRVTQSTVSFHVKALEHAAGARLVDRGGGAVKATATGKIVARYATKILALHDEAVERVGAEERGERGTLCIAASTIPGEYLLPPALAKLHAKFPGVSIVVDVSDTERAAAALASEDCEIALLGARVRDRRLVLSAFADDEIVLVGPRGTKAKLTAHELAAMPLVLREEGSATHQAIARLVHGSPPSTVRIASIEGVKRCVLGGLGLAFLSRHAIADELTAGTLAVIGLAGTPVRRAFYTARLRHRTLSRPAAALLAML
jgi:DNA-binding transcriptional LysR family regulator